MVGMMCAKERISAVEFWNNVSEQLQEVIDNSIDEIEQLEINIETHDVKNDERTVVEESRLNESALSHVETTDDAIHDLSSNDHQYHFLVGTQPERSSPKKQHNLKDL